MNYNFRIPLQHVPFGLDFSFYSREEVEKLSVCKVYNPVLFDTLNNPCKNGLYDPSLGPLNRMDACPTCKLNQTSCPGHMGHIEFPYPLFNPFLFPTLVPILRAKCFRCHSLRHSPAKVEAYLQALSKATSAPDKRQVAKEFISKAPPKCEKCGCYSPRLRRDGFIKILVQTLGVKAKKVNTALGVDLKYPPFFTPREVKQHFELLWKSDSQFLNQFIPAAGRLGVAGFEIFFLDVILVPPSRFRPPSTMGDQTYEHKINALLGTVLQTRRELLLASRVKPKISSENSEEDVDGEDIDNQDQGESPADYKARIQRTVTLYFNLQVAVNIFLDSGKNPNPLYKDANAIGIRQILERKEGLFRQNMMGKRVNYSARSVISPDPYIRTCEVGVPTVFASKLTFPEPVTSFNIEKLRKAVINGPNVYPGANYIEDEQGNLKDLSILSKEKRMGLAQMFRTSTDDDRGNFPKRVYRHLINGDPLLVNRQPTLHKVSMMAHIARVLPNQRTIRLHYANCSSYNADFDGDEMNLHFPQTYEAKIEALNLALADQQYTTATAGTPIRGLIQDHVIGGFFLTLKDTFLTRSVYSQLIYAAMATDPKCSNKKLPTLPPAVLLPKPLWTGKQVVSTIIRIIAGDSPLPNISCKGKVGPKLWGSLHSDESVFEVRNGDVVTGVIDKNQIGPSQYGLIHSIYELYGADAAGRLLSSLARLFTTVVQYYGCSIGIADMVLNSNGDDSRRELLTTAPGLGVSVAAKFIAQELSGDLNSEGDNLSHEQVRLGLKSIFADRDLAGRLDSSYSGNLAQLAGKIIDSTIPSAQAVPFPKNNLGVMAVIGAKGSNVNVSQISCLLGQQALEGRRVPIMVSGRSLPSFAPYDPSPKAGGFVGSRFLTGISPQEYYFHCMAGREGLIDTAVKTANSGYLQRCIIKSLESLVVQYDGTVREADGSVVQFLYGEDGLSTSSTKFLKEFSFLAANYEALKHSNNLAEILAKVDLSDANNFNMPVTRNTSLSVTPYTHLGHVSTTFSSALEDYIKKNPESILSPEALTSQHFRASMYIKYQTCLTPPGEAVGALAGQSIGEPSTQMTLNTFHLAGHGAANVTLGIPRLREIIMSAAVVPKTPSMNFPMMPNKTKQDAITLGKRLSRVGLSDVWNGLKVTSALELKKGTPGCRVYNVEVDLNNKKAMKEKLVSLDDLKHALEHLFLPKLVLNITRDLKKSGESSFVTSNESYERERKFLYRLQKKINMGDEEEQNEVRNGGSDNEEQNEVDQSNDNVSDNEEAGDMENDEDSVSEEGSDIDEVEEEESEEEQDLGDPLKAKISTSFSSNFTHPFVRKYSCSDTTFSAVLQIPARLRKLLMVSIAEHTAKMVYVNQVKGITRARYVAGTNPPVVSTEGVNFAAIWALSEIVDINKLYTNDIHAILMNYGVEAARSAIVNEISSVFGHYGISVDRRHLSLLSDFMTRDGTYKPCNRMGMDYSASPLLKMTFETSTLFLMKATIYGEEEKLITPAARIVLGQRPRVGTGICELLYPIE
ncbi:hypothetical protein RCL1_003611 [Eukaryota sp. TZLM3-RCL]